MVGDQSSQASIDKPKVNNKGKSIIEIEKKVPVFEESKEGLSKEKHPENLNYDSALQEISDITKYTNADHRSDRHRNIEIKKRGTQRKKRHF